MRGLSKIIGLCYNKSLLLFDDPGAIRSTEKKGRMGMKETRKKLYKLLSLILCLAVLAAGCGKGEAPEGGVSAHGQLAVREGRLVDARGEDFQLRGMSTHGIAWFPRYINAGSFAEVKKAGGNLVRVAMYTDGDMGYFHDPQGNMDLVIQAIENARALDLYVLVDWHILSDGDPNANLDRAITFFDAIASRYPNDPAILYEICNEPNGVRWEEIKQYAYAIFPVIRQYSPDAVIVLGTPDYSYDLGPAILDPFPGENFLYAFHYYAGQHDHYNLLELALEKGLPVMVSEWGINTEENGQPALEAGEEFLGYLNSRGISWCGWSLCNKDEVFSVLKPDCGELSGWLEEDLTEVGKILLGGLDGGEK